MKIIHSKKIFIQVKNGLPPAEFFLLLAGGSFHSFQTHNFQSYICIPAAPATIYLPLASEWVNFRSWQSWRPLQPWPPWPWPKREFNIVIIYIGKFCALAMFDVTEAKKTMWCLVKLKTAKGKHQQTLTLNDRVDFLQVWMFKTFLASFSPEGKSTPDNTLGTSALAESRHKPFYMASFFAGLILPHFMLIR